MIKFQPMQKKKIVIKCSCTADENVVQKDRDIKNERMRIMKKRKLMSVVCAAMTAIMLVGCGNSNATSDKEVSKDGKVHLKYYIWSDEENYMTEIVNNYNSSQDKTEVELVSIPNETYDDKLKVMLSGGSDADLVDIRGVGQLLQYKDADVLLDITDNVKNSDLDISKYGPTWDDTYTDGVVTALPTRTTSWMLFYNVDLFKEAGIEMPEQPTWDDYREMAKKLTKEDGSRLGGTIVDWHIYQSLATTKGTYIIDDDLSDVRDSLEYINNLINVDKTHTALAEIKSNDSQYLSDFENGKTGMLINGEWLINMLITDQEAGKTSINWEVAPMPIHDGQEPGTTWGAYQFSAINKTTKHPEESYDFLQYLCSEGGAEVMPKYGMLPAYSSETAQETFESVVDKESASKVAFNAKRVPEAPTYNKYNELLIAFSEHAELYLYGEKTLDETMKNFEKQRENIMKK